MTRREQKEIIQNFLELAIKPIKREEYRIKTKTNPKMFARYIRTLENNKLIIKKRQKNCIIFQTTQQGKYKLFKVKLANNEIKKQFEKLTI